MQAAIELCSNLEIEMLPTKVRRDRERQTHAGRTIEALIENYGAGHATITLRAIVESIGNETELRAETIWAIFGRQAIWLEARKKARTCARTTHLTE